MKWAVFGRCLAAASVQWSVEMMLSFLGRSKSHKRIRKHKGLASRTLGDRQQMYSAAGALSLCLTNPLPIPHPPSPPARIPSTVRTHALHHAVVLNI